MVVIGVVSFVVVDTGGVVLSTGAAQAATTNASAVTGISLWYTNFLMTLLENVNR
ncbi:hypothetical protein [Actinophytocola sp. NPDC049390]|uniref:hypothetical protein n=1 Tax=Actinophytocola sp. NPDC049390 TaxID=3363894 RepID=UPI0037BA5FB7